MFCKTKCTLIMPFNDNYILSFLEKNIILSYLTIFGQTYEHMIYSLGYICYLKIFGRALESSFFSCCLNYIIFSLFVSFKTYNLGQFKKFILLF